MGRRSKFTKEVRITACKSYLQSNKSHLTIAKELSCTKETVRRWVLKYLEHGSVIFDTSRRNKSYTKEFKQLVINQYINDNLSTTDLAVKYKISVGMISNWVNKYYNGIENKKYDPKGEIYTMKSRKVTFEEKV